ncbi:glycosyltransferase [Planctomicrobium sp.]|nr:glycosyltransferase [Planctomicrobium sp.]MDB4743118.1 glycosyltransferase [Planctomicrobium sp.]
MHQSPHISIIIPISDHSVLAEIVHSLAQQNFSKGTFETIAVDSVGGDFLENSIQGLHPDDAERSRLQCHSIPIAGRGTALNEGVRRATGDLYLFLGDDFIPEPNWISEHVELHLRDPRPEVVGMGPAIFPDHLMQDRFTRWLDESGNAFGVQFRNEGTAELSPLWFYGANTSIKPSLLWRAGLFDDDFPYDALDDLDLGRRLFRLGMRVEYLPEALAIHEHEVSLSERQSQFEKVGESAALIDAKQTDGPLPRKFLKGNLALGKLKRSYWKIAAKLTGRDKFEEFYWKQCLDLSYQRGYARAWKAMVDSGKPQRRLSSAFQDWMELAIEKGVLQWHSGMSKTEGLYPFVNEDSQFIDGQFEDVTCLSVQNSLGTPWIYFRIEPIFSQYLNHSIELNCRVYSPRATQAWVEYDSTDADVKIIPGQPGAFKTTQRVKVDKGWTNCRFQLPDFSCQERINGGDFRIACGLDQGEEFRLQSVEVSRRKGHDATSLRPFNWLERIGFAPAKEPRVSIIIPVHNHLLYTLQCLQSIAIHPCQDSYEVIVVDDASTDDTRETLSQIPGLKLVSIDDNLGFTGACNRGAREAQGELLLFLNNDTVAMTSWLDEMVKVFDVERDAGVVGSRLIYPQTGEIQHIGIGFNHQGLPYHYERDDGEIESRSVSTEDVPAVTGACFLTPSKLFGELGGFDPIYESECQDIDYCLKVASKGLSNYCCGRSILLHYESVTRKELEGELTHDLKLLLDRWNSQVKAA